MVRGPQERQSCQEELWASHMLTSILHWVPVNMWEEPVFPSVVFGYNLTPSSHPVLVFLPPLHLYSLGSQLTEQRVLSHVSVFDTWSSDIFRQS